MDNNKQGLDVFEAQIRECYGRVVYTHKTHEKCADLILERWSTINFAQISLSALAAGGFITVAITEEKLAAIVGAFVATFLFALNTYVKNYDHARDAERHKKTGAALWLIRERYLSLITDVVEGEESLDFLKKNRDGILFDLSAIYESAPSTNSKAYARAQDALKNREDLTFTDKEIDAFLPAKLKSSRFRDNGHNLDSES